MRRTPYTAIGIRRLECSRVGCSNRANQQWQICADGNVYRPLCIECDIEINRMVLEWMGFPNAEQLINEYREKMLNE